MKFITYSIAAVLFAAVCLQAQTARISVAVAHPGHAIPPCRR
jgi:hypothetical protein